MTTSTPIRDSDAKPPTSEQPSIASVDRNGFESVAEKEMPYRSQFASVDSPGRDPYRLAYLDEGPVSSDLATKTILCVHGNPTWSFYYRRVVERFSTNHRVVAVDHLGCGRSDKPSSSEFAYTMSAHRDNLVQVIEQLDLTNIVLLAHDWGGAIGLAAAHQCIDRFAGVMLLNTAAFPPPYMPRRIAACRWPIVGTPAVRGLNLFAKAAITMAMSRTQLSAEAARGLLAPYDSWDHRVAIDRFVRDIPLHQSHPTYETLAQLESNLEDFAKLPIQLIWGMKDWCFRPECLRRFEEVWPHARVNELATTGHYVLEDSPEETLDTIAGFLESCRIN